MCWQLSTAQLRPPLVEGDMEEVRKREFPNIRHEVSMPEESESEKVTESRGRVSELGIEVYSDSVRSLSSAGKSGQRCISRPQESNGASVSYRLAGPFC